jgi:hypothetical protein
MMRGGSRVILALVFAPFFSHYFSQFLIVLRNVGSLNMTILDPAAVGASKPNMIVKYQLSLLRHAANITLGGS